MDKWFERLVEQIRLAPDQDAARKALAKLTVEAEFTAYSYANIKATTFALLSNCHPDWQDRYFEKSFSKVDPIIIGLRSRKSAFSWSSPDKKASKEVRQFFSEAAEFGIRSGITVPVTSGFGEVAMLTLISDDAGFAETRQIDPVLAAGAVGQVHARLDAMGIVPKLKIPMRLKAEELTCLRWASEGKSYLSIADIENLSYSAVRFHINNAKQALGAASLSQATSIATALRLI